MKEIKEEIFIHIQPNDLETVERPKCERVFLQKQVYILSLYSFPDCPNFDINILINDNYKLTQAQKISLQKSRLKFVYTFDEIMNLIDNNIDFYLLCESKLKKILFKIGKGDTKLNNSEIFLLKEENKKYIYFSKEVKYIYFKFDESYTKKMMALFLENNPFNQKKITNTNVIEVQTPNDLNIINSNLLNEQMKSKIIQSLILIYANEQEIMKLYSEGIYDLKNFYLINKSWIDKFKEMYHYNEICTIPEITKINSLNECIQNMENLESLNEIKHIYNKINFDNSPLFNYNLSPNNKCTGESNKYSYPFDFIIINESLLDLLKQFTDSNINSEYEINFGKKSLCIRPKNQLNIIYVYNYKNNSFNLTGIISLTLVSWQIIYETYLSKNTFNSFLAHNNINLNIINQKQNLYSSNNNHLGYIYLLSNLEDKTERQDIFENEEISSIKDENSKSAFFIFNNNNLENNFKNKINLKTINIIPQESINIQLMNENNPIINPTNDNNELNEQRKSKIIQSLIMLNINEKEIKRLYSEGTYDLKNFYLVNKSWIDKFKEIYNYNEICNIPEINGINYINDIISNLNYFESLTSIQNLKNKINPNNISILSQINLAIETGISEVDNQYNFPINFTIIHESILNILISFNNNNINYSEYEISFGKSCLCIRWIYDPLKIYFYNYDNNTNSYNLLGIFELFSDIWRGIYNRHFASKSFFQYLTEKGINLYLINQKQNYISRINEFIGYICITSNLEQNNETFDYNNNINSININNNINAINNINITNDINNINERNNNLQLMRQEVPISDSQNKKVHTSGLCNVMAASYMNATLQCLCNINFLRDYFLNNKYIQIISNKNTPLTKKFGEVIKKMWTLANVDYNTLSEFNNLVSIMRNSLSQDIQNYSANDAKDLVIFLLQTLHLELHDPNNHSNEINLKNDSIPNELYEYRKKFNKRNYSIISQTFFYEQSLFIKCQTCDFKSYKYSAKGIIEFTLDNIRKYKQNINNKKFKYLTLYDCFDFIEQPISSKTKNTINCPNCQANGFILSYIKLYTCPQILTIIINRENNFDIQFSFPMNISLEKYVTDKTYDPSYDLIAVLAYVVTDMNYNHFVAYCRSPINGEWFYYDDAIINICEKNFENKLDINGIPYILFYQRRKNNCINFIYNEKKGFYNYNDDNKYLYQAYNEFRNLNLWAPKNAKLFLNNEKNQLDINKSIIFNGINNGDNILIKI